jgi:hypothetical protein
MSPYCMLLPKCKQISWKSTGLRHYLLAKNTVILVVYLHKESPDVICSMAVFVTSWATGKGTVAYSRMAASPWMAR